MLSGKGVVALAAVLGLVTSFMVWYYVDKATAQARPVRMVPVLVAARQIPQRTAITKDSVKVIEVPAEARHPDALTDIEALKEQVSRFAMMPDEQILTSKLFANRKESGLAFIIPEGRRAVSVALNEVIGSGGLIIPGDNVDVVVVYQEASNGGSSGPQKASIVLQNVEVLAVAQLLEGDEAKSSTARTLSSLPVDSTAKSGTSANATAARRIDPAPQPAAKTVTLSVTPEEAARLILAEEVGTIRLALRANGDTSTVGPLQVTMGQSGESTAPPAPAPTAAPPSGPIR